MLLSVDMDAALGSITTVIGKLIFQGFKVCYIFEGFLVLTGLQKTSLISNPGANMFCGCCSFL